MSTSVKTILIVAGSLMVGAFLAFLWKQSDYFNITTIDDFLGRIFGAYLVLYSSFRFFLPFGG
jgi:prolipoprotein diacylglyceryltransferase